MHRTLLAAVILFATTGGASAQKDEDPVKWSSPLGVITYAAESAPYGELEYETPFGDGIGRLYVDGLSGEFGGMGPLSGFWSESDVSHDDEDDNTLICPFAIIDNYGRETRNWGRLVIAFDDDFFPANFIAMRGRCFEDPHDVIPGKLVK